MPRRSRTPLALLAGAALAAAGCGNERFEPGSIDITPTPGSKTVRFPRVGLTVDLPDNMVVRRFGPPGIFRGTLAESYVAGFVYRRREQLPRNARELRAARRRLVSAVRKRPGRYRSRSSRTSRLAGARTVELIGDQTLSKRRLRIRSLHVYKGSAEYVIEIAAPVAAFSRFDRAVTPRIRRSLRVTGKVRARG